MGKDWERWEEWKRSLTIDSLKPITQVIAENPMNKIESGMGAIAGGAIL